MQSWQQSLILSLRFYATYCKLCKRCCNFLTILSNYYRNQLFRLLKEHTFSLSAIARLDSLYRLADMLLEIFVETPGLLLEFCTIMEGLVNGLISTSVSLLMSSVSPTLKHFVANYCFFTETWTNLMKIK